MKLFSIIHIFLLAYIIAALSFWWISLEKQSNTIYQQELNSLPDKHLGEYKLQKEKAGIELRKTKRSNQYMGEGLTFLVITLVGSSIVFTANRFQNKLSRQQNNFMLSVTHELKSPIAAMKLTLQTLQKHKLEAEKQNKLLALCNEEADRLNDLCNSILIASQMDAGQYKIGKENFSISELVQQSCDMYESRYPSRISSHCPQDIMVFSDATLLQLVVHNLIENAIKYTPKNSAVFVELERMSNKIFVRIKDEGQGIPEAEKKKVFQKFYRIGSEETRKTKGTGLGLYLSAKIMKHLKGTIALKDNKPNGCIFEIQIPA